MPGAPTAQRSIIIANKTEPESDGQRVQTGAAVISRQLAAASVMSESRHEHDECTSGPHLCDGNAICTNTIRGHLCTCKPGYVGNGTICRDTLMQQTPNPLTGGGGFLCSVTRRSLWFTPPPTSPNRAAAGRR
ncbi:Protein kinase C-binding protein NELL1 [Liparis tanakae]|uniref:Protein kinase C-binding protein NELL1 n=1 Tax=Liparis tanakae TaxID=230148 RepID=A0A4Z2IE77_9TELE|nr:Protein kinase C-binding protein NELL1 [Liparis tanakae]